MDGWLIKTVNKELKMILNFVSSYNIMCITNIVLYFHVEKKHFTVFFFFMRHVVQKIVCMTYNIIRILPNSSFKTLNFYIVFSWIFSYQSFYLVHFQSSCKISGQTDKMPRNESKNKIRPDFFQLHSCSPHLIFFFSPYDKK